MPDKVYLRQFQALPLRSKVLMTELRIREWYNHFHGDVCVSFSGGKDSTVLADLVHKNYPDVPLVFANTGLEYPEIQAFARKMGAEFVRPKMSFSEVISKYGYPIISKENAEAIYYARRIRNSVGGIKTHGKTGSVPWWNGESSAVTNASNSWGGYNPRGNYRIRNWQNSTANIDRMGTVSLMRKKQDTTRNLLLPWGGYDGYSPETCELDESSQPVQSDKKRTDWTNWRRNAIAGVGDFTEEKQSIFNKSKWLPLCRDTQFKISHMCCSVMKKGPMKAYQKKTHKYPYIGTLTEESKLREQAWIKHGCNAFDAVNKTSQPMSFWTEQDVLHYIYDEGLEIASVYGDIVAVDEAGMEYEPYFAAGCNLKCTGCSRTGCVFCGFGVHLEKGETRFQRLAKTHPKQYEYCMGGGQWVDNPEYDPSAPEMDGEWKNWNPKRIWVPSKKGLGMKKVFDDCNQIYGKDFIRYE